MISTITNRSIKRAPTVLAVLASALLPVVFGAGCGGSTAQQTGHAGTHGMAGQQGQAGQGQAGQGQAGQGQAGQGAAGQGAAGQGAAGQGGAGGTTVTPTITSISVTPANQSIAKNATQQFTAQATMSDGTMKDVSATATWTSSMMGVATISASGLATGVAAGTTAITAASGGVMGSTTLMVTVVAPVLQSIAITPADPKIASGTTQALVATGTFDDGSKKDVSAMATWTSATMTVATVSNAGVVTGVAGGTSVISAKVGTVTGMTTLTVTVAALQSIAVTPDAQTIATGTTLQYRATGTFKEPTTNAVTTQDLTSMVTWSSGTVATATITSAGLASAKAVGSTTITAKSGTIMGSTTLTVTMAPLQSIEVTTTTPSIAKGATAKFVATGTFMDGTKQDLSTQVAWASATPGTATISNTAGSNGVATSVAKGTTVISAKLGTITGMLTLTVTDAVLASIAVSAELPVSSATPKIAKGTKVQLVAIGTYTDSSTHDITGDVTWASTAGVTVSNADATAGLATAGNAAATAMITATSGTGATAIVGKLTLTVTNETLASILIKPATQQIAKGTSLQYQAIGFFTDASQQDVTETVTWASGTTTVATISNANGSRGRATGAGVGGSMITATLGAITDTATLTVSTAVLESIEITPPTPSLPLGTSINLTATGIFSDKTKQDVTSTVTWASATPAVATISNAAGTAGKVTPVSKGTSEISAAIALSATQKVTGKVTLTVQDIALKSIAVTAASPMTIEKGTTLQFAATGTFTDGSTQDLTKTVTWKSDPTTVATISNATGSIGLATAAGTGTATISATSSVGTGSIVGSAVLTVNDGKLVSIAVTAPTSKIALGTSVQFVATGTFNDGAKQDITSSVTWSSDTPANATVDTAGLVTGSAAGTAKIVATQGTGAAAVVGNLTLTVTAAKLKSIVLDPHPSVSIAKGTTVQFKATGFFDDTTQQDLTDTATWVSSATAIATISNAAATNGLLQSVGVGMTNVTASVTIGGATVTSAPAIPVTVTTQTLVSIAITTNPASAGPTVAKGATLDLVATGTYTDGSTQTLTAGAVTWTSAAQGTATVSNQAGQRGRVTGVAVGMVEISATSTAAMGSKVGKVTITVTAPVVTSIAVTPVNPAALPKTMTRQFAAQATLTDGTKQDVSATATWASSDTAVATISASGLLTGVAAGTTQVTAKVGTVTSNQVAQAVTN